MFHQPGEPTEGYGEFAPPLRDQFTLQQLVKHRTVPDTEKNLHRRKLISAWLSGLEIGDDDPKKRDEALGGRIDFGDSIPQLAALPHNFERLAILQGLRGHDLHLDRGLVYQYFCGATKKWFVFGTEDIEPLRKKFQALLRRRETIKRKQIANGTYKQPTTESFFGDYYEGGNYIGRVLHLPPPQESTPPQRLTTIDDLIQAAAEESAEAEPAEAESTDETQHKKRGDTSKTIVIDIKMVIRLTEADNEEDSGEDEFVDATND